MENIIPLYKLETLNSGDLIIARDVYQRDLRDWRVYKIVSHFNEMVANEPKVSFRDGGYYVFDGQHTIVAREMMNDNEHVPILCKVYYNLTEEDEAMLFALQTGDSSKPTSGETLRAMLASQNDVAIAFRDATESVGFKLDMEGGNSHKYIKCINTTLGQYHRFGVEIYTEGLSIIMDAWHGIHSSLNGEIIKAVMYFVYTYHNIYKRSRLVQALSNAVPGEIYKAIKSDFDLTGDRKGIFQIWLLYNSMDRRGRLAVIF